MAVPCSTARGRLHRMQDAKPERLAGKKSPGRKQKPGRDICRTIPGWLEGFPPDHGYNSCRREAVPAALRAVPLALPRMGQKSWTAPAKGPRRPAPILGGSKCQLLPTPPTLMAAQVREESF